VKQFGGLLHSRGIRLLTGRTLTLLLTSIVLGAGGQLLFKHASRILQAVSQIGVWRWLLELFTTGSVLAAFACFAVSAVLWIAALRDTPLSVAYPMVALSYIIIFAGSYFLFSEPITWHKTIGAVLIIAGIIVISRGA
jgi:drug/metabolite transporter (DMT)-like permease